MSAPEDGDATEATPAPNAAAADSVDGSPPASRVPRPQPTSHQSPVTNHQSGIVSLVGAGPGDPELITVGGVARLARADCVVYDRLANPKLLVHAPRSAEMIYVGKQPDRHTLTQDEINALLIEKGRAGLRVVRLKGGDPFVFGRGGEEAEALSAAGVPFEVVPGVTSANAAPAYAGIPITHRALASSFTVVTGHEDPAKDSSSINWGRLAAGADTLVFLMGTGRLLEIATSLIAHGRAASTPVAVVEWGTLPRQRTVTGTLATIADAVRDAGIVAPAVTIVGEVAGLREGLRWFDKRPLIGKRILVTRTREQASELSRALAALGAEAIELPTIEIAPSHDAAEVASALENLRASAYGWVVFTSANGVSVFMRHVQGAGFDARAFGRAQLAAIGPGTAAELALHGLQPDLVPARYVAEGLLDALASRVMRGQRILVPRASAARGTLIDGIAAMGARVDELTLYRSVVPLRPDASGLRRLHAGEIDIVTFASSSSVRNLIAMLSDDGNRPQESEAPDSTEGAARGDSREALRVLRGVRIAAIGPVTAQAVRDAGLDLAVMAEEHTIEGLVGAIVAACAELQPEGSR